VSRAYLGIVEILRQHVEAMESHGFVAPVPRSMAEVTANKEVRRAVKAGATTMLMPF